MPTLYSDPMIPFDHWFLPPGETHLQEWMTTANRRVDGRLTYQYHKYEAAMRYVTRRHRAVDVGAHCGLWSYWMARDFDKVDAFEPVPAHRDCWSANLMGYRRKTVLYACALGDRIGTVSLTPGVVSTGDTCVTPDVTSGSVQMLPLDSFYDIRDVDLLKIDCEGWELFVLRGAEKLLRRDHPVVIVEQKPGHASKYGIGDRDALAFLGVLGYVHREENNGDVVLTWDSATK